jgi:membrane fusion protein (multidrug efflux system)
MAKKVVVPVVILAVAAALIFTINGCWTSWTGNRSEQKTDDAYVRADLTPLSTRISGTVRSVNITDYQAVKQGQILVELNDEDYRATVAQAQAALAAAEAELATNDAAKVAQDAQIQNAEAGVNASVAAVTAAEAGVASAKPDVERTETERKRQEALLAGNATTHQKLEQAVADAERFEGILATRQADLERAKAALASSKSVLAAQKSQRVILDSKDKIYRAEIEAKRASIAVAEVNLGYTKILSPIEGAAGERHVQPGQLVGAGMEVLSLVKGDVWIQANYKETQLRNIRPGDTADLKFDAFPGVVLHGKVAEISPASGSQFALLPPDNATGNFTKVVQRIPVKIVLDPDHALQGQLKPGFSAVVTIHASGQKTRTEENKS